MNSIKTAQARQIVEEELSKLGLESPAFQVMDELRPGANELAWWSANTPHNECAETRYNLAHLRAYVRIAGGEKLFAGGIGLHRGRLWMDRSVISRLTREGYLIFTSALHTYFTVTEKGRAWLVDGKPDM